jgi:hypothetical protein
VQRLAYDIRPSRAHRVTTSHSGQRGFTLTSRLHGPYSMSSVGPPGAPRPVFAWNVRCPGGRRGRLRNIRGTDRFRVLRGGHLVRIHTPGPRGRQMSRRPPLPPVPLRRGEQFSQGEAEGVGEGNSRFQGRPTVVVVLEVRDLALGHAACVFERSQGEASSQTMSLEMCEHGCGVLRAGLLVSSTGSGKCALSVSPKCPRTHLDGKGMRAG